MGKDFNSSEWHTAVGRMVAARDGDALGEGLADAVDTLVGHEGTCLLAFHTDAAPEVLNHNV